MNAVKFAAMSSRLIFLHQRHLVTLAWKYDSKLLSPVLTAQFCARRDQGSFTSSPTTSSSSVPSTLGTGQFGNAPIPPKDVTIPPLMPEEEPPPGADPYSYSSVYRKGRFDFLFGDGWRRPPAKDQGQKMRRDWFCFGFHPTDEYYDWKFNHYAMFWIVTVFLCGSAFGMLNMSDWPILRDWATREAYIEIARREKYGLPYIAKDYIDPAKLAAVLPSDEELGDFEIII